jgi:hypothetical protein
LFIRIIGVLSWRDSVTISFFGLMGLIACADKDATDTVDEVETDTGTNLDTFGVTDPVFFRLVWLA